MRLCLLYLYLCVCERDREKELAQQYHNRSEYMYVRDEERVNKFDFNKRQQQLCNSK